MFGWEDQRLTHRQYLAWQAWKFDEMNRPSRTDHYLMQIALRVLQGWAKGTGSWDLNKMKIEFKEPGSEGVTAKDIKESQNAWMTALGRIAGVQKRRKELLTKRNEERIALSVANRLKSKEAGGTDVPSKRVARSQRLKEERLKQRQARERRRD